MLLGGALLFALPVKAQLLPEPLPDAPDRMFVQPEAAANQPPAGAQLLLVEDSNPDGAAMNRPPCPAMSWAWREQRRGGVIEPCQPENQMQFILSSAYVRPLTPRQKGELAVRGIIDPFNVITIVGSSGINVAADSHTAYGPGLKGWGRLTGYSFLEDATGAFFGTFLIPSLAEEDPRYHRMPGKPIPQRFLHAVAHTVLSQHDDGSPMPNYATLLTYPIGNELANLYVPGIQPNATATAKRIVLGYASDPIGNLIGEFLPDVAKHIHVRIVFVQQIINRAAAGQSL
jgi:hypothetical protein